LNTLSQKNLTMKKLLILAAFATSIAAAAFAQDQKPVAADSGRPLEVIACTIKSSAPPLSKDMSNRAPTVTVDGEPINGSNNNWTSLEHRMENLMFGGWGDHSNLYFRWELRQAEKTAKRVFLGFNFKLSPEHNVPEKVELRLVTSGDNNPIRNALWDPAKLHWSLAPSSEHFATLPWKEGFNEVEITSAVQEWVKRPERSQGFVLSSTTNQKVSVKVSGFTLRWE
jgi:hypothetical protein